jgi:hypothetical protein
MAEITVIDWLKNQLPSLFENDTNGFYTKMFEQAKQMEEEQHKETFKQSRQAYIFEKDMPPIWETFEQYYNETYGKDSIGS